MWMFHAKLNKIQEGILNMFKIELETMLDEENNLVTVFECVGSDDGMNTDVFLIDGTIDEYKSRVCIIHNSYEEKNFNKKISNILDSAKEVIELNT